DVDSARAAVTDAVVDAPPVLEPVQALNAQPIDLTQDPQIATPPIVGQDTQTDPVDTTPSDPGLPEGLIPSDPGLPQDNTNASVTDATAPPPVPPPMMPPSVPQANGARPSDTAL